MGGCLQEMVTKVTRGLLGQGDKVTRRLGADVTQSKVRRWREVKSPALPGKRPGSENLQPAGSVVITAQAM